MGVVRKVGCGNFSPLALGPNNKLVNNFFIRFTFDECTIVILPTKETT
jgi:hypothetical protein